MKRFIVFDLDGTLAGSKARLDVYYGMADNRIGVARLDVPEVPPPGVAR